MIVYASFRSKKRNSKTKKELAEYEAWLKSVQTMPGVSGKKYGGKATPKSVRISEEQYTPQILKAKYVTGSCTHSGIMKDYHKLSESDREIVDTLAMSVAPLHKSNYVYVSEGMNPAGLGRKNEVL